MNYKNTRRGKTLHFNTEKNMGCYRFPLEGEGGQRPDEGESNTKVLAIGQLRIPLTCPTGHPLPQGRENARSGFTLIELLVVVLIIGILAVVALPQYQKAVKKARGTEVLTALDAYDKAISSYYLTHGFYGGARADTLDVQMPILKHFLYASVGGDRTPDFQVGSNFLQVGTGTSTQILLVEKGTTLGVWAEWDKGSRPQRWCSDNGKDISKECAAYFGPCTWNSMYRRCYF